MNTESTEDQSTEIEVVSARERITIYETIDGQVAICQHSPLGSSDDRMVFVNASDIPRLCRALRATAKNAKGHTT